MYVDQINSSWLRAGLRVYFVIVLLLVAWFGDRCLGLRTKLKLLRGEQVQVTTMTGWLRGPSFLKAAMQLRRVPGGFLGVFMIGSALLALLSDLAVSGFVRTVYRNTRCEFTRGLRIGDEKSVPAMYPSNLGRAALLASTAQVTSLYNGGQMGIYYKADNSSNFAADYEDLAGWWTCSPTKAFSYAVPQWSDPAIEYDLVKRGILYDACYNYQNLTGLGKDGLSRQLLIMTTDAVGGTENPQFQLSKHGLWSVRFAVDIEDSDTAKNFQAYQCDLHDNTDHKTLESILKTIAVDDTIDKWLGSIQGKLWEGFDSTECHTNNPPVILAWMLNSIVMVSGSLNSVYWNSSTTIFPDQGCIMPYTIVPWPVILCFSLATFLGLFFTGYLVWLHIAVHLESRRYDRNAFITTPGGTPVPSKEIRHNTPNGLLDWMQHAVHESGTADAKPRSHHLSKWLFSTKHHGGRRLGVVSKQMSASTVNQYFAAKQNTDSVYLSPPTPEPQLQGLFGRPSPNGSSYFPRKPVRSADYNVYQQLPNHDYDVGINQVRHTP